MLGTGGALVAAVPPILVLGLGVTGVVSLQTGFTAAKCGGRVGHRPLLPSSRREARACPCG